MKDQGARQTMANQRNAVSQKCIHHANNPRKATLTDVGWTLGAPVVPAIRSVASREVQFSDQPGQ